MTVDPVADTSGTRGSSASCSRALVAADHDLEQAVGRMPPMRSPARRSSAWQASAVSGVRCDGFQITGSPQTSASAVFQLHTATGKLNAADHRDRAERMPRLEHAVARAARTRS